MQSDIIDMCDIFYFFDNITGCKVNLAETNKNIIITLQ